MSWLSRKAIGLATVTLSITETNKPTTENPSGPPITHIDIAQTLTGGIPGTTECRILDFVQRPHTDHIFGSLKGQTRWCRGAKSGAEDGKVRPNPEILSRAGGNGMEDAAIARFLRGEEGPDGTVTAEGFLVEKVTGDLAGEEGTDPEDGVWVQTYVENVDAGWAAEQVCSFFLTFYIA